MAEQGGKRPRPADDIDAVIKAELAADMAKRMAKKSSKEPKTKGMTLAQIEDSEGGPIKESMIATAQIKRAALRKKGGKGVADDDADVDMPEDVDQFEEDKAEVEQEGGVKIIPFSLQEERETGHFDEEGNYVEEKENRDDMDAWLDSAEVVDEKLLETIEARKKAEAEAEEAVAKQAPVTERQLAAAKADLASHMLEGETVTRALKRIRGSDNRAAGSRGKSVKDKTKAAGGEQAPNGDLALFERLTELVDMLFAEGETDIFTTTQRELQRSAEMWLPKPAEAGPSAGVGAPAAAESKGGADDDDDDMFAEADVASRPFAAKAESGGAKHERNLAPGSPDTGQTAVKSAAPTQLTASVSAPATVQQTNFESWPIKELKRFLEENGVETGGIVEKCDLVSRATQV
mmetsp:Transcript_2182/g.5752  ORF Transcript_2182/g.5752 Transcript_2182/m.5752 type:complete len:405 (+) Transcript_2182:93-1307(+)